MILRDEIFPIGQITKPHGLNGEMAHNPIDHSGRCGCSFVIWNRKDFCAFLYRKRTNEYRYHRNDKTGAN